MPGNLYARPGIMYEIALLYVSAYTYYLAHTTHTSIHCGYYVMYLFFSLSRSLDVTPIRGHLLSPLRSRLPYARLRFYREKTLAIYSVVDSHRIAPTHAATRSQQ